MTLPPEPTPDPPPGAPCAKGSCVFQLAQAQNTLDIIKCLIEKLQEQLNELQCCQEEDDDSDEEIMDLQ